MNARFLISALLFLGFYTTSSVQASKTAYDILEEQYLIKFPDQESNLFQLSGSQIAEKWTDLSVSEKLSPRRKRELLLHHLFPECFCAKKPPPMFQTDIWRDMQVFNLEQYDHLYDAIFPGASLLGKVYGACQLVKGSTDKINILTDRQNAIRHLFSQFSEEDLSWAISELDKSLNQVIMLLDNRHPFYHYFNSGMLYQDEILPVNFHSLFQNLEKYQKIHREQSLAFNKSGRLSLQVYLSYFSVISLPLMSVAQVHLSARARRADLNQGLVMGGVAGIAKLGSYGYLLSLPVSTLNVFRDVYEMHENLKKMNQVITSELLNLKLVFDFISALKRTNKFLFISQYESGLLDVFDYHVKHLVKKDQGEFFHENLKHAAGGMRVTIMLHDLLIRTLKEFSRLDFLFSVRKQMELVHSPYTFVDFMKSSSSSPYLFVRELKNPLIDHRVAVGTDARLGGKVTRNIVLTGVNASGKSTFLRAVGINTAFLAQTLGIAAAETFKMRTYSHINTLMEKNDELGRSSFETEANQVVHLLKRSSKRAFQSQTRELVLADELLRTTNPQEAAVGSYIIAEEFGQLRHLSLILSTHLTLLKDLSVKYPELFVNKHMQIYPGGADELPRPTYKLVDGPSQSTNTLTMLEQMLRTEHPELLKYMDSVRRVKD